MGPAIQDAAIPTSLRVRRHPSRAIGEVGRSPFAGKLSSGLPMLPSAGRGPWSQDQYADRRQERRLNLGARARSDTHPTTRPRRGTGGRFPSALSNPALLASTRSYPSGNPESPGATPLRQSKRTIEPSRWPAATASTWPSKRWRTCSSARTFAAPPGTGCRRSSGRSGADGFQAAAGARQKPGMTRAQSGQRPSGIRFWSTQ